jgi:hypothetical protein
MATMTRDAWIAAFATELGIDPPDAETIETLLDMAGVAAHASERTAAPIACFLAGVAGVTAERALATAQSIAPTD